MTIKVKMRGEKAIVRFNNPMEEKFFQNAMVNMRDNQYPHPKVSVKNKDGEVPPLPKPKPMGKPVVVKPEPISEKPKPLVH